MELTNQIISNEIAKEVEFLSSSKEGLILENTLIHNSKTMGLVFVVLHFNYNNQHKDYFCLPYAMFVLSGWTRIYYDQNVSNLENRPTIDQSISKARNYFKHNLDLLDNVLEKRSAITVINQDDVNFEHCNGILLSDNNFIWLSRDEDADQIKLHYFDLVKEIEDWHDIKSVSDFSGVPYMHTDKNDIDWYQYTVDLCFYHGVENFDNSPDILDGDTDIEEYIKNTFLS